MRIGELATAAGVTTKTLRFYETAELLPPPQRTASGYRNYDAQTLDRLSFIRSAQRAGLTLAQISEILAIRDRGYAPCQHMAEQVARRLQEVDQRLAELRATRRELRHLRDRLAELDPTECVPDEVCSAVNDSPAAPDFT